MVPESATPAQNTKLIIGSAQYTGRLLPASIAFAVLISAGVFLWDCANIVKGLSCIFSLPYLSILDSKQLVFRQIRPRIGESDEVTDRLDRRFGRGVVTVASISTARNYLLPLLVQTG